MGGENGRLSREKWLAGGLEALSEEGVPGLRTERLSRRLGVTTGSFYWHFENRADFERRLLEYWTEAMTLRLIEEMERAEDSPRERLYTTYFQVQAQQLARYETPVRAWALAHPKAREAVAQVDEIRLRHALGLLRQLGFRGAEAQMRARTLLLCAMTEPAFFVHASEAQQRRWLRLRLDLLTEAEPGTG